MFGLSNFDNELCNLLDGEIFKLIFTMLNRLVLFLGYLNCMLICITASRRSCMVTEADNVLIANCAYKGYIEVPTDLNPRIKKLILSHNNIERITNNSLSRYVQLRELYLNDNLLVNNSLHRNAFVWLKNLQVLDLRYIRYNIPFDVQWPRSLNKLMIGRNPNQNKLNFSSLSELTMLNADECSLQYFPRFSKTSKIKYIDVSKNPLNEFSVKNLAGLCRLEYLILQWTKDSTLNGTQRWCDCLKIQTWINQRKIIAPNLNCSEPDISEFCDVSFEEENLMRYFCLERTMKKGEFWTLLIFALIPIVILICIWCICS